MNARFQSSLHACDVLSEPGVILHVLVSVQKQVISPSRRLTKHAPKFCVIVDMTWVQVISDSTFE